MKISVAASISSDRIPSLVANAKVIRDPSDSIRPSSADADLQRYSSKPFCSVLEIEPVRFVYLLGDMSH